MLQQLHIRTEMEPSPTLGRNREFVTAANT
jgi:hypothetical protein